MTVSDALSRIAKILKSFGSTALVAKLNFLTAVLDQRAYVRRALLEKLWIEKALAEKSWLDRALAEKTWLYHTLAEKGWLERALAEKIWLEDVLRSRAEITEFLAENARHASQLLAFREEFDRFAAMAGSSARLSVSMDDIYPQLSDRTNVTLIDRHYTYHPAWAARIIAQDRPAKHVDISSILHFSTLLSAFVPVDFYDFRPAPLKLEGLQTGQADLTNLPFASESIASLSCMHVLEHIGLGRYGEPLDPDGDLKAIRELVRVLGSDGNLLVAVPVGRPRVAFNAHRIYDHEQFASYFPLELVEFALIEEDGPSGLRFNPRAEEVRAQSYGCGCFWFRKTKTTGRSHQHEPPRVCRRPFGLSYAAMAGCSSMA